MPRPPMNLPDPAATSQAHLVADWVELAATSHPDGEVSGDVLVDAREEADDRAGRQTTPPKTDARRREAEDVWILLRARAEFYGPAYPFTIANDRLDIQTARLDANRLAYAFLLAASSLSAFARADRHLLTGGFERASRHVLAALLPHYSTVSVFGTASAGGERYNHGRLIDRLDALATDLVTQVTLEGRRLANNGKERSSGDGGLDLIGWPDLIGPRKRLPVYFGQCACGDDWHVKPYEVIAATWDHRLEPVSPIVPVTFIPYAYRTTDHDWPDLFAVIPTVLIDRPRWIHLVTASGRLGDALLDVPAPWLLEQLPGLAVEEPDL
jgi:hypothetical protein